MFGVVDIRRMFDVDSDAVSDLCDLRSPNSQFCENSGQFTRRPLIIANHNDIVGNRSEEHTSELQSPQ